MEAFSPAYNKILFLLKKCLFSWSWLDCTFFFLIVSGILNSIHIKAAFSPHKLLKLLEDRKGDDLK